MLSQVSLKAWTDRPWLAISVVFRPCLFLFVPAVWKRAEPWNFKITIHDKFETIPTFGPNAHSWAKNQTHIRQPSNSSASQTNVCCRSLWKKQKHRESFWSHLNSLKHRSDQARTLWIFNFRKFRLMHLPAATLDPWVCPKRWTKNVPKHGCYLLLSDNSWYNPCQCKAGSVWKLESEAAPQRDSAILNATARNNLRPIWAPDIRIKAEPELQTIRCPWHQGPIRPTALWQSVWFLSYWFLFTFKHRFLPANLRVTIPFWLGIALGAAKSLKLISVLLIPIFAHVTLYVCESEENSRYTDCFAAKHPIQKYT